MPVASNIVLVGTSPTPLATGTSNHDPVQVWVRNDSGATVYLGGPTVTTSQGFPLPNNEAMPWYLGLSDTLYAVASAPNTPVAVGRTRA